MRSTRSAEWILSLVTSPDRAAAIVGDLMEDDTDQGRLRFWSAVPFIALSLLGRDLAASPLRMTGLAVLGVVALFLLSGVLGVAAHFLVFVAFHSAAPGETGFGTAGVLASYARWVSSFVAQFVVGRMLARLSPGRELAPCVALTVLVSAVAGAAAIISPAGSDLSLTSSVTLRILSYDVPFVLAVSAGALAVRRRRVVMSTVGDAR